MTLEIDSTNPEHLKVRFTLAADHPVGQVSVVGTFNDWTPGLDSLAETADGTRSVTLGLPYGRRQVFRYLGPGAQWFDDPDADAITDEGSILEPVAAPTLSVNGHSPAADRVET